MSLVEVARFAEQTACSIHIDIREFWRRLLACLSVSVLARYWLDIP